MNETYDKSKGKLLLSDLYMDYKNSEMSKDMSEEQIKKEVTKIYTKVHKNFEASAFTDKNKSKIRFSLNHFIDGVNGRLHNSMTVPRKYSAKQINVVLEAPYNYKDDLIRMSMYFYIRSQEFKGIIDYKSSMLTYANTVYPYGVIDETKFDAEEYFKNIKFIEDYNVRSKLDLATKIALREDVYFAYEMTDNSGKNFIWKKLPSQYCKIIGKDRFETYRVAFDLSYFNAYPEDLDRFPIEFREKFNTFLKNNKTSGDKAVQGKKNLGTLNGINSKCVNYVELSDKAIAFKFDESVDYVVPYYSGLFIDLIRLAELKDVEILSNVSDNYKLLHQLVPMNKESGEQDDYLISGEDLLVFHNNLKGSAPEGVGTVTTPMPVEAITLKGNVNSAQESITSKQVTSILTQSGTSKLLFNGESTSALGLNKNIQVDENVMFRMLRQYEKYFNKRLYLYNKGSYKYHVNFLDSTQFNKTDLLTDLMKAGQAGMNTQFEVNAVLGRSQTDYLNTGKLINMFDMMDNSFPFKSSHVQDGSGTSGENGDKKTETNITEDGMKSRERDL